MSHKLIDAAVEAVACAKCDHEFYPMPRPKGIIEPRFDRYACRKCECVMWAPIEPVDSSKPQFDLFPFPGILAAVDRPRRVGHLRTRGLITCACPSPVVRNW